MLRQRPNRIDNCLVTGLIAMSILTSALAPVNAQAQEGGDLQAQILYAFHTEDARELLELSHNLLTQVDDGSGAPALRYHLAHAEYRYAELVEDHQPSEASHALDTCIRELATVLRPDGRDAEALILQSACYAELASLKSVEKIFLRARAKDRIATALVLAPENPRALLIRGQQKARDDSQSRAVVPEIQRAAEAFEHTQATSDDTPGWGHAEAYLLLGHELRMRGEIVSARNWIEQALIVAPDYRAAQRERALLGN